MSIGSLMPSPVGRKQSAPAIQYLGNFANDAPIPIGEEAEGRWLAIARVFYTVSNGTAVISEASLDGVTMAEVVTRNRIGSDDGRARIQIGSLERKSGSVVLTGMNYGPAACWLIGGMAPEQALAPEVASWDAGQLSVAHTVGPYGAAMVGCSANTSASWVPSGTVMDFSGGSRNQQYVHGSPASSPLTYGHSSGGWIHAIAIWNYSWGP